MANIDGFPEQSMTGQFLSWGRSDSYAPSLLLSDESTDSLRETQRVIHELDTDVTLTKKLHATILFCPPRHLLEAIQRQTNYTYDVPQEAAFYADVANALSTMVLFSPSDTSVATEKIERFDEAHGVVALRLSQTALVSEWRQAVRDLMEYNLRSYHGVTEGHMQALAADPKLKWLFAASLPHITLASNYSGSDTELATIPAPDAVNLVRLAPKSPLQFLGLNSLKFDPDAAFEHDETE